jgi:hypothetical protein
VHGLESTSTQSFKLGSVSASAPKVTKSHPITMSVWAKLMEAVDHRNVAGVAVLLDKSSRINKLHLGMATKVRSDRGDSDIT